MTLNTYGKYQILIKKDTPFDNSVEEKLKGQKAIFIDRVDYQKYLEDNLQNITNSNSISLDEKSGIIYDTASNIMQDLFKNPETNIHRSKKIVHSLMDDILNNDGALKSLMKVTSYDYYTYTHSIDVTIYSLGLAKTLLFTREELEQLGTAAILHDIGKSKIDYNIVNKSGRLTEAEFYKIKKHPVYGHAIAVENGISDKNILSGIRSHHEKYDGTGYPDGLTRDKISVFAEIIAIADIFDALTTKRSYKEPFSTFDSLLLMKKEMSHQLNNKFLNKFITLLR